jgi:hypothetical protein
MNMVRPFSFGFADAHHYFGGETYLHHFVGFKKNRFALASLFPQTRFSHPRPLSDCRLLEVRFGIAQLGRV